MIKQPVFFIALFSSLIAAYFIIISFISWGQCVAGGGGLNVNPPSSISYFQGAIIEYNIYQWGALHCLPKKQSQVKQDMSCHFKKDTETNWTTTKPELLREYIEMGDGDAATVRAIYACKIPAFQDDKKSKAIEYYFEHRYESDSNVVTTKIDKIPFVNPW